ncbi:MAG: hypothetical protein UU72_C0035G0005 [candidate division WWE3 bacterium GW2011_GWB1_41_6]|uniref:Uncharacterized protein n=1 Tax=candidate division WWE3 bacterium GW2011_GWB1_41_6 TaxID=1619112 RepID=A0A0G0WSK7_UNCKA|nr:MAG: hypothetical protein UU72_C0035G0005 [candidate division WWE3 bacterium GW2011_GWB1_41_6]
MRNNIKKTLTNTILGRSVTGFAVVVVVALLFLFPMRVLFSGAALAEEASDLTITCPSSGSCSIAPSGALFNVTNMAPGDYVERSITIENARTEDSCALTMTVSNGSATPGDFPEKLFTAINDSTDDIYGEFGGNDRPTNLASLDDLFTGPISLGNLSEGQSRTYTWGVLFDTTAGNAYQNADTEFDISLGIECLDSCSTASEWVSAVSSFHTGTKENGGEVSGNHDNPEDVLGPNDNSSYYLGYGGYIVVEFNVPVKNAEGNDLTFYKNDTSITPERKVRIQVSQDGTNFHPSDINTAAIVSTLAMGSGSTSVDINSSGLDWFRYVKVTEITDDPDHANNAEGFDLDAIKALSLLCSEPSTNGGSGGLFAFLKDKNSGDNIISTVLGWFNNNNSTTTGTKWLEDENTTTGILASASESQEVKTIYNNSDTGNVLGADTKGRTVTPILLLTTTVAILLVTGFLISSYHKKRKRLSN